MGAVINSLNKNNVKLNITAVYTAPNGLLMKIDKKTKVIISLFIKQNLLDGKKFQHKKK